jgi:general secretion pathway protein G
MSLSYFLRETTGVTLIELLVVMVIVSILAAGVMPLSQMAVRRSKEITLRENLRKIRKALDEYKALSDEGKISSQAFSSGYPKNLEVLVNGVDLLGPVPFKKKFLRRIPKDPMTEDGKWGLRSYFDQPGSDTWGGEDVYDVYTTSDKKALDGSYYKDW